MRTHTALHILCGVVWQEFQIPVTGGNMDPGKGRLDFPLDAINTELGRRLERRINDEIERAREIMVTFLGCKAAASGMLDGPHVSIHNRLRFHRGG